MQGAEHLHRQGGGLFQQGLHGSAVFAHDVGVIAAGIVQPVPLKVHLVGKNSAVQRAEGAEAVGRVQGAGGLVKAHHHLGPVHHGGHGEPQGVAAGAQGAALGHDHLPVGPVGAEELPQHGAGFGVYHQLQVGPEGGQPGDLGAVVRLHVADDQIIQRAAGQQGGKVLQPGLGHGGIHRIQQQGLFVQDQVGVVAYAPGNGKEILKQGQAAVTAAQPIGIGCNEMHIFHGECLLSFYKNGTG